MRAIEIPRGMSDEEAARRLAAPPPGKDALLLPSEVAALLRVDPKTVIRWANTGKLTTIRTPGGHRRYYEAEIYALIAAGYQGQVRP